MNVWDALFLARSRRATPLIWSFGMEVCLLIGIDCILPIVMVIKSLPAIFPDFTGSEQLILLYGWYLVNQMPLTESALYHKPFVRL